MTALIVFESLFGNTEELARAVAEGIAAAGGDVEVERADRAADRIGDDVSLLVVGGPTHAFSMTRASTREDAVVKGAPDEHAGSGIREWIERVEPRTALPVVTFDTRIPVRMLPGSAAKSAAKALRHRGFDRARQGETFWVVDMYGPLKDGELDRARAWGRSLVAA